VEIPCRCAALPLDVLGLTARASGELLAARPTMSATGLSEREAA
jgi:hypothetical protein